ncbi:hypothetical protein F5887DRAFT_925471 [Amanita rubescens]|nr:hypothetical protein F5887DRAFT_925471 [Amanita rubescens]
MRKTQMVDDFEDDIAPPDSEFSDIDESQDIDDIMAMRLALIMEKLATLESRMDRLEEQVSSKNARRTAQAQAAVETSGATIAVNTLSSPARPPVTPKRAGVILLSPKQHASPRRALRTTRPAESQSGGSRVTGLTQVINHPIEYTPSSSVRPTRHLPAHYFGPNPIVMPDEVLRKLEHGREGIYYVVTEGLEPGVYKEWYEVASVAKNVPGGIWSKKYSKQEAVDTYRDAYNSGFCRRIVKNEKETSTMEHPFFYHNYAFPLSDDPDPSFSTGTASVEW